MKEYIFLFFCKNHVPVDTFAKGLGIINKFMIYAYTNTHKYTCEYLYVTYIMQKVNTAVVQPCTRPTCFHASR